MVSPREGEGAQEVRNACLGAGTITLSLVLAAIPEALQRQAPGHGGGPVLTPRGSTDMGTSPLTVAGTTAPGSQSDRPLNDNVLNPLFISCQRHLLNMHSICGTGGGGEVGTEEAV